MAINKAEEKALKGLLLHGWRLLNSLIRGGNEAAAIQAIDGIVENVVILAKENDK